MESGKNFYKPLEKRAKTCYNEKKQKGDKKMDLNIAAYLVDIVIAIVVFIGVLKGAKKGFITCLFGFISTIVALIAAFSFATLLVDMTGGLFGLEESLTSSLTASFSNIEGFNVVVDANANVKELLLEGNISNILVKLIAEKYATVPDGYTLGMMAGETVAHFASALIAGIALFFVLKLVFAFLKKFFNFIAKGGLLGSLNKILGAVVGFIEAILLVSLVVTVLSMIPAMAAFLNGSILLTTIYQINPIAWFIALFLL